MDRAPQEQLAGQLTSLHIRNDEKQRDEKPVVSIFAASVETQAMTDRPKSTPTVDVKEAQYHETPIESTPDRQVQPVWQPSLLRLGPLAGLAALILAFLLILCSYAILAASNGDLMQNWEYSPIVYLAIFVAVGNKAMAFAAIQ